MLYKQLQYFIAVVDCKSFSEAAQQCFISQSAISQQIRALELDVDAQLLHRANRSFTLTQAGEYLYREAKELIASFENIKKETTKIAEHGKATLHIGYLRHYEGNALQSTIAQFSSKYPNVELHMQYGDHEDLYDKLRNGELDLALSDQRRLFSQHYINYQLLHCPCYVAVPPSHALFKQEWVELDAIQKDTCIVLSSKKQIDNERDFYQDLLNFHGRFLFAETILEARMMAMNRQGILLVEGNTLVSKEDTLLKKIPLKKEGKAVLRNYCAFWKKQMGNAYIEEFAEMLRHELRLENEVQG